MPDIEYIVWFLQTSGNFSSPSVSSGVDSSSSPGTPHSTEGVVVHASPARCPQPSESGSHVYHPAPIFVDPRASGRPSNGDEPSGLTTRLATTRMSNGIVSPGATSGSQGCETKPLRSASDVACHGTATHGESTDMNSRSRSNASAVSAPGRCTRPSTGCDDSQSEGTSLRGTPVVDQSRQQEVSPGSEQIRSPASESHELIASPEIGERYASDDSLNPAVAMPHRTPAILSGSIPAMVHTPSPASIQPVYPFSYGPVPIGQSAATQVCLSQWEKWTIPLLKNFSRYVFLIFLLVTRGSVQIVKLLNRFLTTLTGSFLSWTGPPILTGSLLSRTGSSMFLTG